MTTRRTVTADTLAAALCRDSTGSCVNWTPGFEMTDALHAEGHQREAAAILAAIPPDPRLAALRRDTVDACINIVQQSLDTVRAEDDGESRTIKTSIAAREHVIRLLTGYRDALAAFEDEDARLDDIIQAGSGGPDFT